MILVQIYWYRYRRQRRPRDGPLLPIPSNEGNTPAWTKRTLEYVGGLCFVTLFGLAAWWLNSKNGMPPTQSVVNPPSQVLGWLSTTIYGTSYLLAQQGKLINIG